MVKSKGADIQISGLVHYRYKRYGLVMLLSHEQPAKLCFPLHGKIFTFGHDNIDSNQWNPSNDRQKIEEVGNKEGELRKIEQKKKKTKLNKCA